MSCSTDTKANVTLNELSSIDESSSSTPEGSFDAPPAVVVVEGYFDAIALSNVGVKNVLVASMGTALPLKQLKIAAQRWEIYPVVSLKHTHSYINFQALISTQFADILLFLHRTNNSLYGW